MQNFPRKQIKKVLFIFSFIALAGCAHWKKIVRPHSFIRTSKGTELRQESFAQEPARISSNQSSAIVSLPKGSLIRDVQASPTSPAYTEISLAEKTDLKLSRDLENVSGAKTFAPEVGPSPVELAKGKGVELSYWLSGGLLLLCGGLAYTTHFKAAIVAGICAVLAPVLALFVSSSWGVCIAAIGLLISVTLYFSWYMMHKHPEIIATVKQEVEAKILSK